LGFERAILAGSSFAGLEMPLFARRYPRRVAGIIFLDAI
jgi:pimeloyl-ACP methyl ester carboxylesterase